MAKTCLTKPYTTEPRARRRSLAGAAALAAAVAALLGVAALPAHAAAVTYSFAGSGDWSSDASTSSFSGSFSYDSTATDSIGNGITASYAHPAAGGWGMSLSIDGIGSFTLEGAFSVNVSNNLGGWDRIGALASDGTNTAGLDLQDFSAALLGDVSLGALNGGLTLADFDWSSFLFENGSDTMQGLLSAFDCVSGCTSGGGGSNPGGGDPNPGGGTNNVPEPASAVLALLALGAAGAQCRRGSRASRTKA